MNSAKRFVSIAAVGVVIVLVAGLVVGSIESAIAAPPFPQAPEVQDVRVINTDSEPVPVVSQGTTNVSGSVDVTNWPIDPLPVAQQGSVEVFGAVGIDLGANTVQIDSTSPVSVVPQGTTDVSGSVQVTNWPTDPDPLPVAQQGSVEVYGAVGIDPSANTVQIDSTTPVSVVPQGTTEVSGSVAVTNWPIDPVPVAPQGSVEVYGAVGIDPSANTVQIDASAPVTISGKVAIDAAGNTVKIDSSSPVVVVPQGTTSVSGSVSVSNPTSNPVPVSQQGTVDVSGSVGLSTSANTVKLDATYNTVRINSSANLVKLDSNGNIVRVINPAGEALDVRVVDGGGGGSAPEPVQFTSSYADSYTWTNAYTVPAGKILKIENVSVYAESPTLFPVISMRTTLGGVTSEHWLPALEAEYMPQMATGTKIFSGSNSWRLCTQVAIYADENTAVQSVARCNNGGPAGCGSPAGFNVTFSGYLTDK